MTGGSYVEISQSVCPRAIRLWFVHPPAEIELDMADVPLCALRDTKW